MAASGCHLASLGNRALPLLQVSWALFAAAPENSTLFFCWWSLARVGGGSGGAALTPSSLPPSAGDACLHCSPGLCAGPGYWAGGRCSGSEGKRLGSGDSPGLGWGSLEVGAQKFLGRPPPCSHCSTFSPQPTCQTWATNPPAARYATLQCGCWRGRTSWSLIYPETISSAIVHARHEQG